MEYLLKASAIVIVFYIFYKIILQRDTFFELSRWFLLFGLVSSFVIPLIVIPIYVEQPQFIFENTAAPDKLETANMVKDSFNLYSVLLSTYFFGLAVFTLRFIFNLSKVVFILKRSKKQKSEHYICGETTYNIPPFSFFNFIIYNPKSFNTLELEQIILHEKIHARQMHSVDVLFSQIACVVLWFNPLVWLYNKDLKQNLEFIADKTAIINSGCKKSYQYTLLKLSMPSHQLALTNNFYNSLIKKRIVMLHKSKSKSINQLKYILIVPILTAFLMSFNTKKVYVEKEKPIIENPLISNALIDGALITDVWCIDIHFIYKSSRKSKYSYVYY